MLLTNPALFLNVSSDIPLNTPLDLFEHTLSFTSLDYLYDPFDIPLRPSPCAMTTSQGMDVLPPSIFPALLAKKQSMATGFPAGSTSYDGMKGSDEVDLRDVMKHHLQQTGRLYSVRVDGTRHDLGTPKCYYNSLTNLADAPIQASAIKKNVLSVFFIFNLA